MRLTIAALSLFLAVSVSFAGGGNLRVVSLAPSLTEIVFKLGCGNMLVGRSSACDYPKEVEGIPVAGGFGNPSLEKLLALKPDIVLATALKDPSVADRIRSWKIKLIRLPDKSLDDYYISVRMIGKALGCDERAECEVGRVRRKLDAFLAASSAGSMRDRPKVYLEVWHDPYMTVGRKSFLNEMIFYAGGRNIMNGVDKNYLTCSAERIIQADPDVIICPAMRKGHVADVLSRPGWSGVAAVRNGKVYVQLEQSLIYRLGPRLIDGVALLRKCVEGGRNPKKAVSIHHQP